MTGRRVLVVGGGIAGLSVAKGLADTGWDVVVIERSPEWSSGGTGIYLPANAYRAMHSLGFGDAVLQRSQTISRQVFLDHRGKTLTEVDVDRVWGDIGPCLALPRSALHQALLDANAGTSVRMGTEVTAVAQEDEVVTVEFSDGTGEPFDLVIGADGINSSIRRLVFDGGPPQPVGQVCWRFLTEDAGIDAWTVQLGHDRSFLVIPIGNGRVYCYLDLVGADSLDPTGGDRRALFDLFSDFADPAQGLLTDVAGPVYFSPIEEVLDESCVAGSVVLIGDAAHATSPNMAQGAAMAFEDALVLVQSLMAESSVGDALGSYATRRLPRTKWVRDQTHRRDRLRHSPAVIRNLTLRLAGSRIFRSNYEPLFPAP